MTAPASVPNFAAGVPMFLDAAHVALASELRESVAKMSLFDHDAPATVKNLQEKKLFSLLAPKEDGGRSIDSSRPGSIDVRALCIAREHLGYVAPMADSIFAVQGLGSHAFVLTKNADQRARILQEAIAGSRVCAFALTEPDAGSDVASMKSVATRDASDGVWKITGEKVFISNVGIADHYIVFANADVSLGKKGISAFMVDKDAPGLVLEPVAMAVPHPLGRLKMNACSAKMMIGELGHGLRIALSTLDVFRTSVGAAACGMARRALDESLSRVKSRVQFGKPLSEQPIILAKLADMATELDASRLLVYRAAWEKDHGARAAIEVAMAKMFATEAAQRIIDSAVQLHGGIGVTEGSVVEQLYREIRPLRIYEGTTEIQQMIIGTTLTQSG